MDNNPINWNNSMLVDKVAGEEATPTEQFNPMYKNKKLAESCETEDSLQ